MHILILVHRARQTRTTSHAPQHRKPVHKVPLFHECRGLFTVETSLSGELYILVEISRLRDNGGEAVCRTSKLQTPHSYHSAD